MDAKKLLKSNKWSTETKACWIGNIDKSPT